MATLHVTRVVDPARLLDRAVDGLFPLAPASDAVPWPTLRAWVVLRQGGLRDDLIRVAAARGVPGWFDAPVCLFNEMDARWAAEPAQAPLDDAEREALLSRILADHAAALLGGVQGTEAWVPAVDRFIGELIAEGIAPEALAQALQATAEDGLGTTRAAVIARVYAEWHAALVRVGRVDGRDAKVRLAAAIMADPAAFAKRLGGRREIRLVGLADLRGGWRVLLRALAASAALDRVEVLTSAPLALDDLGGVEASAGVADDARRQADWAITFAESLFSDQVARDALAVTLLEAPDTAREIEQVAVRVRALIDGGVAPREIAVIAREARPTVDAVAAALGRLGVPVTARRRTALAHTATGRALAAILRAAAEQWSRHSMAELAEHPLLRTGLDPAVVNQVGYASAMGSLAGWREALDQLLARCERRELGTEEPEERRAPLPPAARVRTTIAAWTRLAPKLEAMTVRRPLGEWCAWVARTLEDGEWGIGERLAEPCADESVWQADLRARDAILGLATSWQRATGTFDHDAAPLDAEAFGERFALMLAQDVVTAPATDFGVVVAEALAAGWRSFAHVFVVGLSAGAFPRRPAPGPLFDPVERRALSAAGLALDPVDAWRDRERELFRVLCAGARESLTLSWPTMDADGREVARSAYVDEAAAALARRAGLDENDALDEALRDRGVLQSLATHEQLVPGYPIAREAAALSHARELAAREAGRSTAPGPWNGTIEDPALVEWLTQRYGERFVWSATQLEEAAKCRWQWFASRLLKLEERQDADDLMEPTTRGVIVHEALDRLFVAARAAFGAPAFLRTPQREQARELLATALSEAWNAAIARGEWLGPVATRTAARAEILHELLGYLDFEIAWNESTWDNRTKASKAVRSGAEAGEFRFDAVALEADGVRFRLRGTIDRVERGLSDSDANVDGADGYVSAIDYKSTKYSVPAGGKGAAWDDGIVLQLPLYAAALRALRPEDRLARIAYRSIRGPAELHVLNLAPVRKGEVQQAAAQEAEAQLAAALAAAARRIREVRRGEFPAAPAPSAGCSPFCAARDICRIPGGPVDVRG